MSRVDVVIKRSAALVIAISLLALLMTAGTADAGWLLLSPPPGGPQWRPDNPVAKDNTAPPGNPGRFSNNYGAPHVFSTNWWNRLNANAPRAPLTKAIRNTNPA